MPQCYPHPCTNTVPALTKHSAGASQAMPPMEIQALLLPSLLSLLLELPLELLLALLSVPGSGAINHVGEASAAAS